jgi:WD40 repeat protein
LEGRCKVLTVENESLKAEVEMYRAEAAALGPSNNSSGVDPTTTTTSAEVITGDDDFVKSGNGIFPSNPEIVLDNLHGMANLLACSLSPDDTILATGGADKHLSVCQWGGALDGKDVKETAKSIDCGAPVICVGFAKLRVPFVAGGCMDGSVHLVKYSATVGGLEVKKVEGVEIKHSKYVKTLVWHESQNILATASADGSVYVHKLNWSSLDEDTVAMERIETLQLPGPVEALCFHGNSLICYARGTPHLSTFDMDNDFAQTKINLNQGAGSSNYQDHVSFCVMRK